MKEKTLIFDLDGTLVDAKELHHLSFEWAVQQQEDDFVLTSELKEFLEGLPTLNKVEKLNTIGHTLDAMRVYDDKQTHTELHMHMLKWHPGLPKILESLSNRYNLAIVSNARSHFVYAVMALMNITKVDIVLSANFIPMEKRKPDPYGFNKAIMLLGADPEKTTIIEDSPAGIESAKASIAAKVIEVKNSEDTYAYLETLI